MNQPNFQSHGHGAELRAARYFNDAVIGLKILYEMSLAGSPGAEGVLRNIAECVCRQAALWATLYPHGEN